MTEQKNSTEIIVVLDRSGSMKTIAEDMIEGFCSFTAKQRELQEECRITIIQFDDIDPYDLICEGIDIHAAPELSLVPRGRTPLLDTIGLTIVNTNIRLAALPENKRPNKVLCIIITDGKDNASKEYKKHHISDMISEQQAKHGWEFVFLGANQDAIAVAQDFGLYNNAVTYQADKGGTERLWQGLSTGVSKYRTSNAKHMEIMNQQAYNSLLKNK